ncbi:hypothetical protein C8R47DRAFT_515566 [Mycena vitilis]|nr:hypothetical protein C8R47DRAFT_515566 [Mycena vitilis]
MRRRTRTPRRWRRCDPQQCCPTLACERLGSCCCWGAWGWGAGCRESHADGVGVHMRSGRCSRDFLKTEIERGLVCSVSMRHARLYGGGAHCGERRPCHSFLNPQDCSSASSTSLLYARIVPPRPVAGLLEHGGGQRELFDGPLSIVPRPAAPFVPYRARRTIHIHIAKSSCRTRATKIPRALGSFVDWYPYLVAQQYGPCLHQALNHRAASCTHAGAPHRHTPTCPSAPTKKTLLTIYRTCSRQTVPGTAQGLPGMRGDTTLSPRIV